MQAAKPTQDAGSAVSRKVVRSVEQRESVLQKYNWAAKGHCQRQFIEWKPQNIKNATSLISYMIPTIAYDCNYIAYEKQVIS